MQPRLVHNVKSGVVVMLLARLDFYFLGINVVLKYVDSMSCLFFHTKCWLHIQHSIQIYSCILAHTILYLLCMQLHCWIATAKGKAQNNYDQGDQENPYWEMLCCYVPQFLLIQKFYTLAAQSTDRTLTLLYHIPVKFLILCTSSLDKVVANYVDKYTYKHHHIK